MAHLVKSKSHSGRDWTMQSGRNGNQTGWINCEKMSGRRDNGTSAGLFQPVIHCTHEDLDEFFSGLDPIPSIRRE